MSPGVRGGALAAAAQGEERAVVCVSWHAREGGAADERLPECVRAGLSAEWVCLRKT